MSIIESPMRLFERQISRASTSRFTATLDGLGPVGGGAHAVHEFVVLDRLAERAALLALLLLAPALDEAGP